MPENPSTEELERKLSPALKKLYNDDSITVPLANAWEGIDRLLLEWQRSRVSETNLDTIAPVLLALNTNYKLHW